MHLLTKPLAGLLLVMLIFSNLIIVDAQVLTESEQKTTQQTTSQTKPQATPTPTPSPSQTKAPVLDKGDETKVVNNSNQTNNCPPTSKRSKKVRKSKKRAAKKAKKPMLAKKALKKKSTSKRKTSRKKSAKRKKAAPKAVAPATPVVAAVTLSNEQLQQIVDSVAAKLGANKLSEEDKKTVRQIVSEELGKTKTEGGSNPSDNLPPANSDETDPKADQTNKNDQQSFFGSLLSGMGNGFWTAWAWATANWHIIVLAFSFIVLWLVGRKYKWARWLSYAAIAALLYFWGFFTWLWGLLSTNLWLAAVAAAVLIAALVIKLFGKDIAEWIRRRNNPEVNRVTPDGSNSQDSSNDQSDDDDTVDGEPVFDDDDTDGKTRKN